MILFFSNNLTTIRDGRRLVSGRTLVLMWLQLGALLTVSVPSVDVGLMGCPRSGIRRKPRRCRYLVSMLSRHHG